MRRVAFLGIFVLIWSCQVMPVYQTGPQDSGSVAGLHQAPDSSTEAGEAGPALTSSDAGMLLVEGEYCTAVVEHCLKWLDPDNKGVNGPVMCAHFAPSTCVGAKVHKKFYIDRFEFPNVEGAKPLLKTTWTDMKASCEGLGKRLCTRSEWTFACEGPDIHPYPYGDGYHRDDTACNIDRPYRDPFRQGVTQEELDQSVPSGSMPRCVSPFGVHDMTGNADEFVFNTALKPYKSGLQGGHWVKGARNRCRPMTDNHNEWFTFYPEGGRCCKDYH
jgi:sulfatase modifying factor 1